MKTKERQPMAIAKALAAAVLAAALAACAKGGGTTEAQARQTEASAPLPSTDAGGGAKNNTVDGVEFTRNGRTLSRYPATKADGHYLVPSTVEEIADGAFAGNRKLKTIVLPYSVKKIGSAAFEGCTALVSAEVPDTV